MILENIKTEIVIVTKENFEFTLDYLKQKFENFDLIKFEKTEQKDIRVSTFTFIFTHDYELQRQ